MIGSTTAIRPVTRHFSRYNADVTGVKASVPNLGTDLNFSRVLGGVRRSWARTQPRVGGLAATSTPWIRFDAHLITGPGPLMAPNFPRSSEAQYIPGQRPD